MKFRSRLMILVVGVLAVSACKARNPQAQTKSVDNFAGRNVRNACSGKYPVKASPDQLVATSPAVLGELATALTAIPSGMQDAFFLDMKGRIIVTPATGCARADATSCWRGTAKDSLAIYIKEASTEVETTQNVRESTVQAFAYWLSEVALEIGKDASGTAIVGNTGLFQIEGDLVVAMLDMMGRDERLSLANFQKDLPAGLLVKNMDRDARAKEWAKIAAQPGARRFAKSVLAETFDSWYCSVESRNNLAALFTGTDEAKGPFDLMSAFSSELEAVFAARGHERELVAQLPVDDGTASGGKGLGLWGRWGADSGPLRQAVSNWSDWRSEGNGLVNFQRFDNGGGLIFRDNWFNPYRWGGDNQYSNIQSGYAGGGTVNATGQAGSIGQPVSAIGSYSFANPGYTFYDSAVPYVYYP